MTREAWIVIGVLVVLGLALFWCILNAYCDVVTKIKERTEM